MKKCNHEWIILESIKAKELLKNIHNENIMSKKELMFKYNMYREKIEKLKESYGHHIFGMVYYLRRFGSWTIENKVCKMCKKEIYEIDKSILFYKDAICLIIDIENIEKINEIKEKDETNYILELINYKKMKYTIYNSEEIKEKNKKVDNYIKARKELDDCLRSK